MIPKNLSRVVHETGLKFQLQRVMIIFKKKSPKIKDSKRDTHGLKLGPPNYRIIKKEKKN